MNNWQFWSLNMLAVLAVVVAVINVIFFQSNRDVRQQVAQRQQFINQATRINQINTEVIKALARLAVEKEDAAIRDLLQQAGVTYRVTRSEESGDDGQ